MTHGLWHQHEEERMKKIGKLMVALMLSVVFLVGCSGTQLPEVIDSPTVSVSEDGQITYWLVGEFDKDYYKVSELSQMAVEEAKAFNESWNGKITGSEGEIAPVTVTNVEQLTDSKGTVVVTYQFGNWESYTDFNETELFYGTVGEAALKGYSAKVTLKSVKDDSSFTEEQIKQATDKYIIITDLKADIYCAGKIAYISEGAVVNEDGSIDTTGVEGLAYIMLK